MFCNLGKAICKPFLNAFKLRLVYPYKVCVFRIAHGAEWRAVRQKSLHTLPECSVRFSGFPFSTLGLTLKRHPLTPTQPMLTELLNTISPHFTYPHFLCPTIEYLLSHANLLAALVTCHVLHNHHPQRRTHSHILIPLSIWRKSPLSAPIAWGPNWLNMPKMATSVSQILGCGMGDGGCWVIAGRIEMRWLNNRCL